MIKRTSIEARFCRKHKTSDQGKKKFSNAKSSSSLTLSPVILEFLGDFKFRL